MLRHRVREHTTHECILRVSFLSHHRVLLSLIFFTPSLPFLFFDVCFLFSLLFFYVVDDAHHKVFLQCQTLRLESENMSFVNFKR